MHRPVFAPGQTVFHFREGRVTLAATLSPSGHLHYGKGVYFSPDGREQSADAHRSLFTLEEAARYGWPSEGRGSIEAGPCAVEFETRVQMHSRWQDFDVGGVTNSLLNGLNGMRVRVRIEVLPEENGNAG